jgi:hypothetical protein
MANYKNNISAILNNDERYENYENYENSILNKSIFESVFVLLNIKSNGNVFYASIC